MSIPMCNHAGRSYVTCPECRRIIEEAVAARKAQENLLGPTRQYPPDPPEVNRE
jgi:hypothetical protein